jgi:hypothetical protein
VSNRRDRRRLQRRAQALHLLWRCGRNDRIYLVERAPRLGLGLAYSTGTRHLLNVRIDIMSAFADEPDHFARWLVALPEDERLTAGERSPAGTFVRRQVYGAYIQHLLEDSLTRLGGGRNLYLITDEATGLRPEGSGFLLETAGGRPTPPMPWSWRWAISHSGARPGAALGRPSAGHRRPALPGLALPRRAARGAAGDRANVRLALGDGRPKAPHRAALARAGADGQADVPASPATFVGGPSALGCAVGGR